MAERVKVQRRADGAVIVQQGQARIVLALATDAEAVAELMAGLGLAIGSWTAGRAVGLAEGLAEGRRQIERENLCGAANLRAHEKAAAERVRAHVPALIDPLKIAAA